MGDQVYQPSRTGKLQRLAKKQGTTIETLIGNALCQEGSIFRAAISLGVAPNSLQNWILRNGYEVQRKPTLVKVQKAESPE